MNPSIPRWLVLPGVLLIACAAIADDKPKEDPKLKLTDQEQKILEMTNKEREAAKLPPLKINPVLTEVARGHSANMAKKNTLAHELDGKNPAQRVDASGYPWLMVAENIAQTTGEEPKIIIARWMESKAHKDNIVHTKFTEIGIGMAKSEKGDLYYTQVFGTPKKK